LANHNSFSLSCAAILTTHNAEKTVVEAITSILSQDVAPDEIFIVDDNSLDSTPILINDFKKMHPEIVVILNQQNHGQSFTRNQAAFHAKSDILVFFDDDDISNSSRIREHSLMHSRGSQLVYVSSVKKYENGHVVEALNKSVEQASYNGVDLAKRLILGKIDDGMLIGWIPAATLSVLRSIFIRLNGFDPNFRRLEDSDFAIRAALENAKFAWSNQLLVERRATFSENKGGLIEMKHELQLLEKHSDLLSKNEFEEGKLLIKVRKYYFGAHYLKLIYTLLLHPQLYCRYPVRVVRFITRILHDRRKAI